MRYVTDLPPPLPEEPSPRLVTKTQVAAILSTTESHVANLDKSGWLPGRCDLGSLPRWDLQVIRSWIAAGCPKRWPA
jgi:predicted DNA-binding transcriptional regulator AlpA